jgi:hypothetical protein
MQGAQTATASGAHGVSGTASATQGGETATASGTAGSASVTGTAEASQGADTSTASGIFGELVPRYVVPGQSSDAQCFVVVAGAIVPRTATAIASPPTTHAAPPPWQRP